MPDERIQVTHQECGIALLTLNRPEARNAIDLAMIGEIRRALAELGVRDDVACLILTGAGDKAFAAGADIAQLRGRKGPDALKAINAALFQEVEEFPFPTIAAIRGYALGGGLELALACDLRVAGEGAKVGQPEVGLGIIPAAGATRRLRHLVGLGRARELIFTGRVIGAEEALQMGLVNRVVPDDQVVTAAEELGREIARNGPLAVRLAKLALNAGLEASGRVHNAIENLAQAMCFESQDKIDRMTAFLEKKKQQH